jgi:hypothetical protein
MAVPAPKGDGPPAQIVCAIHQPNFFPWLGYFDKIRRADVFVFLDDVPFNKSGSGMGCWTNRVRIDIGGQPAWFGCPVRREKGEQLIRTIRIDEAQPWRRRLLRTLETHYRRAPYFAPTMGLIQPLIEHQTDSLLEFNMNAIHTISSALGTQCRLMRQSEVRASGVATERVIRLTKEVGANTYLAGGGADGYQEDALFAASGIKLLYQRFAPKVYGDPARYIPGLSIIDLLMKAGLEATSWTVSGGP